MLRAVMILPRTVHVLLDVFCLFNVAFTSFPFCSIYSGDLGNSHLSQFERKSSKGQEMRFFFSVITLNCRGKFYSHSLQISRIPSRWDITIRSRSRSPQLTDYSQSHDGLLTDPWRTPTRGLTDSSQSQDGPILEPGRNVHRPTGPIFKSLKTLRTRWNLLESIHKNNLFMVDGPSWDKVSDTYTES